MVALVGAPAITGAGLALLALTAPLTLQIWLDTLNGAILNLAGPGQNGWGTVLSTNSDSLVAAGSAPGARERPHREPVGRQRTFEMKAGPQRSLRFADLGRSGPLDLSAAHRTPVETGRGPR